MFPDCFAWGPFYLLLISLSYGMDEPLQHKGENIQKHSPLKSRIKGIKSTDLITSLSSLEYKIKKRIKWEESESSLRQVLQFVEESLRNPLLVEQNKGEIGKISSKYSSLYNIGWVAQKGIKKDFSEEFKKRFKEIFTKNQYDWSLELSEAFYWWERAQSTNDTEAQGVMG